MGVHSIGGGAHLRSRAPARGSVQLAARDGPKQGASEEEEVFAREGPGSRPRYVLPKLPRKSQLWQQLRCWCKIKPQALQVQRAALAVLTAPPPMDSQHAGSAKYCNSRRRDKRQQHAGNTTENLQQLAVPWHSQNIGTACHKLYVHP